MYVCAMSYVWVKHCQPNVLIDMFADVHVQQACYEHQCSIADVLQALMPDHLS